MSLPPPLRGLTLWFGLMLAGSVTAAVAAATPRDREDTQLKAALVAEYDGPKAPALEAAVLRGSTRRATRAGEQLTLKLSAARPVTLRNTPCEDAAGNTDTDCRAYYLIADLPTRHAYLVLIGYYEGEDFWLIDDRTGRRTTVPAIPQFSPDSRELLTIDNDEAYGGDFDLQIWKRSGDRFLEEWSHRTFSGGIAEELVRWSSRDRLSLKFSTTEFLGNPSAHWPGTLVRHGKTWRLEMKPPPAFKDLTVAPPP